MAAQDDRQGARGQAFTGALGPATRSILPAGQALHLHLLRHGEVERLGERVLWGQADVGLSVEGLRQGEALAAWLARNGRLPERVISSDLERCRRLGERVAEALGLELELEPRLREQHLGDWQGRTWEEITAADPERVTAYWRDYVHARPPGGESLSDLAARVDAWWTAVAARHPNGCLAIVTHIGVLRVLLAGWLGLPLGEALRLAPATGSHTAVTLSQAGCVLEVLGERPWTYGVETGTTSGAGGARP